MGSKSQSSQKSASSNTSLSIGIGGDNNGFIVDGSNNNFTMSDHGAIEGAFDVVGETIFEVIDGQKTAILSTNETVGNIATEAMINNTSVVEQVLLGNTETNLAITSLATENGANLAYLTDTAIDGHQSLAETAMNNNSLLVSQFGEDMWNMSDKNAELNRVSMENSALLAEQFSSNLDSAYKGFGADLTAVTESSLNANALLTSEVNNLVGDISSQSNQTLMQMAEMQSRGLDNALEIAGNMSMDDSAEASTDMIKYISIAAGLVAITMVFK